ncbi:hypothetical protein CASFOL_004956 [Castilleja foliolosa]|uniref:Uncharacterized protein n=1 Tax=Castilleja foliolosa TaxID=1961234 RepID=A0ABD3EFM1_9LAMI
MTMVRSDASDDHAFPNRKFRCRLSSEVDVIRSNLDAGKQRKMILVSEVRHGGHQCLFYCGPIRRHRIIEKDFFKQDWSETIKFGEKTRDAILSGKFDQVEKKENLKKPIKGKPEE